jgi:two-component system, LuxR family, secretion system response regulator SsrB
MNETSSPQLTPREIQVLTLATQGFLLREIAEMLTIQSRTVSFHLRNIYDKLEVSNIMQACRKAQALGILPANPQEQQVN